MSDLKPKSKPKIKKSTGTYEEGWGDETFNCQKGCKNNCRYGYCQNVMAPRFNLMPVNGWKYPEPRSHEWILKHVMEKKYQCLTENQVIMFPSMHDIYPENLELCVFTIRTILENTRAKLLIVSKPVLSCIQRLDTEFKSQMGRIEFRFTMGSINQAILNEEGESEAPQLTERIECLNYTLSQHLRTSVSCEPLLDSYASIVRYLLNDERYATVETIWIGAMNYCKNAPKIDAGKLFEEFKSKPQIRFKESMRKHLSPVQQTEYFSKYPLKTKILEQKKAEVSQAL